MRYSVDSEQVDLAGSRFEPIAESIERMQVELETLSHDKTVQTSGYQDVAAVMETESTNLSQLWKEIDNYSVTLTRIMEIYLKAEGDVKGRPLPENEFSKDEEARRTSAASGNTGKNTEGKTASGSSSGNENERQKEQRKQARGIVDLLRFFLKLEDKTDSDDQAGMDNDLLSYAEAVDDFFTGDKKGWTGAEDYASLVDKSFGLEKGIYDYLKHKYEKEAGIFTLDNQKKAAGLGTASAIAGFISSLCGIENDFHDPTQTVGPAGKTGRVIGLGGDVTDIVESLIKRSQIGDVKEKGVYTPLSLWSAFSKTLFSTAEQTGKSIDKYYADGKWDTKDTASVMIEAPIAGLHTMANALSFGANDALFGLLGISEEDVMQGMENFGTNVGNDAGNYILSNPTLHNAYNNANTFGRVWITMYAGCGCLKQKIFH